MIFFHRNRESTEYTVLTHIGLWVKTKINIHNESTHYVQRVSNTKRPKSVMTEWLRTLNSSSMLIHRSVGSNPGHDTCVLEQDTLL